MLGHLIDVVQGTLPAALVVTLLLVAVRPSATDERAAAPSWTRADATVAAGAGVGVVAALALAVLRETTLLVNRELVALVVLVPLLVLETAVVVRCWRRPGAQRLRTGSGWPVAVAVAAALLVFRDLPAVFLQTGGFVAPGESPVSTDVLLNGLGYALGFVLVLVTCWALYRSSAARGPRQVAVVLTGALGLAILTQAVSVVQILLARRLVEVPRPVFRVVVWVLNHEVWLLCAVLAVSLVLPLATWAALRRRRALLAEPSRFANPAEHRSARSTAISRRRFCELAVVGAAAAVIAVTAGRSYDEQVPELSPPEPFTVDGEHVAVPLTQVDDGHLHRFAYQTTDGTEVRFIVIKKNQVAYGVGLDACEVCGSTGYYERGGKVVCKLCDVVMNIETIGFKGGCNPVPLDYTVSNGHLRVLVQDLEDAAHVFA